MFQYAFGRALSLDLNTDLKIETSSLVSGERPFSLDIFKLHDNVMFCRDFGPCCNAKIWLAKKMQKYNMNSTSKFLPSVMIEPYPARFISTDDTKKSPGKDVWAEGYWQSEKYFSHHDKDIRKGFYLNEESPDFLKWKGFILSNAASSVSLHIRRGDYVSDRSANEVHGVLPLEYYKRAEEVLSVKNSSLVFYVFTDDPLWAEENLSLNGDIVYVSNRNLKDYEELVLMSLCRHHVLANSSFSWWGAWLDEKDSGQTIAPIKWFQSMGSDHIVPEKWLRI
jgi:hypothetical protein